MAQAINTVNFFLSKLLQCYQLNIANSYIPDKRARGKKKLLVCFQRDAFFTGVGPQQ